MNQSLFFAVLGAVLMITPAVAFAQDLSPLVPQPSPQQVVDEHLDALNKCDWDRVMAQCPPEGLIVVADGASFEGRKTVGDLGSGC